MVAKCYILKKALTTYKTCNVLDLEFACWLQRIRIFQVSAALNIIAPQLESLALALIIKLTAILWLYLQFLIAEFERFCIFLYSFWLQAIIKSFKLCNLFILSIRFPPGKSMVSFVTIYLSYKYDCDIALHPFQLYHHSWLERATDS